MAGGARIMHTCSMSAHTAKQLTVKLLHKIATIVVAALLYGVLVILQSPKAARADEPNALPHAGCAQACVRVALSRR